jgi:hypothetical protein
VLSARPSAEGRSGARKVRGIEADWAAREALRRPPHRALARTPAPGSIVSLVEGALVVRERGGEGRRGALSLLRELAWLCVRGARRIEIGSEQMRVCVSLRRWAPFALREAGGRRTSGDGDGGAALPSPHRASKHRERERRERQGAASGAAVRLTWCDTAFCGVSSARLGGKRRNQARAPRCYRRKGCGARGAGARAPLGGARALSDLSHLTGPRPCSFSIVS